MPIPVKDAIRSLLPQSVKRFLKGAAPLRQERTVQGSLGQLIAGFRRNGQWSLDTFETTSDGIEIRGWAQPPGGDHARVGFTLNGRDFDEMNYPLERGDLEKIFWWDAAGARSGFCCRMQARASGPTLRGPFTISCADRARREPFDAASNFYFPDVTVDPTPVPEAKRRKRVHGHDSETSFWLVGYTVYVKLEEALRKRFGTGYASYPRILDWGCGCGRLARYFRGLPACCLTGVDIDADNVAWCAKHLGFGSFRPVALHPPTSLPDAGFDLLIGISIFTHLRLREQFEWLAELKRVAAPGAILLMTVLGATAASRTQMDSQAFEAWMGAGFLDAGTNPELDGYVTDAAYYRNSLHTADYIRREWSRYFEIIDLIPGYIGNHQDLVVLRKR